MKRENLTQWIWYETNVPIFLEKFVLVVLAALVGFILYNPMRFDWWQRGSLLVAIVAFAFFLSYTLHLRNEIVRVPPSPASSPKTSEPLQESQGKKSPANPLQDNPRQNTSGQVEFMLHSKAGSANLMDLFFEVWQYGQYSRHPGRASMVTLSVWSAAPSPVQVISCRLANLTGEGEKVFNPNLVVPTSPPEAADVTLPLLELLLGSNNLGSVDWVPERFGLHRVSVTIEYRLQGLSHSLGPEPYDVEIRPTGSLTLSIKVSPHRDLK